MGKPGRPKRKRGKYVRTTISLPEGLWKRLRIEGINKRKSMGELIVEKIQELEELKSKMSAFEEGSD